MSSVHPHDLATLLDAGPRRRATAPSRLVFSPYYYVRNMLATNPIGDREPLICPSCGETLREVHERALFTHTFNPQTGLYDRDRYYAVLEVSCSNCRGDINGLYPFSRSASDSEDYEDELEEEEDCEIEDSGEDEL